MTTRRTLESTLSVLSVLGVSLLSTACADAPGELTETASAQQNLFSGPGRTLWTANNKRIAACFEATTANDASLAAWRNDVTSFITETTRRANVSITGFGACPQNTGAGNVIIQRVAGQGNSNATVGYVSTRANTINYGNDSATNGAPIRGRRNVIIHEFMHTLGYDHEFNRADSDGCAQRGAGNWAGGTNWTPNYDRDSILNSTYCHQNADLTFLDIGGTRVGYGAPIKLSNRVSGYCLEVRNIDSHGAGAEVDVYTCDPSATDPKYDGQWDVRPTSDGYFNLVNKVSNLCLGVVGADDHAAGAAVEVRDCGPIPGDARVDQEWTWRQVEYNRYKLANRLHNYCLSMPGVDSHGIGAGVEVQQCMTTASDPRNDEQWTVTQATINTNARRIVDSVGGFCLGVQGPDAHDAGAPVELYSCDVGAGDFKRDSEWTFEASSDGYFRVRNQISSLCLGVVGYDDPSAGAEIEAYYCDPDDYDARVDGEWTWYDAGGKRRLMNRASGACLFGVGYYAGSTLKTQACASADYWVVE